MEVHTFQITSTNPIILNSHSPFGIRTILIQVMSNGMWPYWNTIFVILTTVSHLFVMGSFSLFASLSHAFRCSFRIPDVPPACPVWIPFTSTAISSPPGGPSGISSGLTSIFICSSSGGCYLYWSSLLVEMVSSSSFVKGGVCSLACQFQRWKVPWAYLDWSVARRTTIFSPLLLTLFRIYSCRADWNFLVLVQMIPWSEEASMGQVVTHFLVRLVLPGSETNEFI